jgi:hypothetical protein
MEYHPAGGHRMTAVSVRKDSPDRPAEPPPEWSALPDFATRLPLRGSDQVLIIAGTGGSKSTLAATLTLAVPSLVAIDEKSRLTLPRATVHELPQYDRDPDAIDGGGAFREALTDALRWRPPEQGNRVILRPYVLDIESFDVHDAIYRAIYLRGHTLTWIDEITATGASAQRSQPWLRAISARGRTRELGLITLTQAPFGLTPAILRRNAAYVIFGPIDPDDTGDMRREAIELATALPLRSGLFIVYPKGERGVYRLHLPIPSGLKGWDAP